ncbi:MAG: prolyl oligopeptidase family serine peptidase [Kiritimatiellae bacterium]|nr:prolyl oligopeptidase family serine peptidase [Kiritimatiellia bacterium]
MEASVFSKEFELYIAKLLIAAETQCTIPAKGWPEMRERVLADLQRTLGLDLPREWPELRPRVEGVCPREGYTIEQVSAEFWPGIRYALQVYRPEGKGPFPGVVMVGTGPYGSRHGVYQGLAGGLARMGILVVGVVALGKGARGTKECAYVYNAGSLLAGTGIAQEQFNTGRRTLDYLCSRPDVDTRRIGITGDSDGGWVTLWVATMDPRITAAAPVVTNYTFGNIMFGQLPWQKMDAAEGCTPESLTCSANIPIMTACNAPKWFRFLNAYGETSRLCTIPIIDGAARSAYAFAGVPERYGSHIADCGHGYWPIIQVEAIQWFCEVFFGRRPDPGRVTLGELPPPGGNKPQPIVIDGKPVNVALEGTPEFEAMHVGDLPDDPGQGAFLPIIDDRRRAARAHRAELVGNPARMLDELRLCLGIRDLAMPPEICRVGDRIETEIGLTMAARWVSAYTKADRAVRLVVGAAADRQQYAETGTPRLDLEMREEARLGLVLWVLALLNRPPLGMWVWDAICAARWLRQQGIERIELVGVGEAGAIIAPLAAALSTDVATLRIAGSPVVSMDEIVSRHPRECRYWAHRLLWVADLPDILDLLERQGRWVARE